MGLFLCQQPSVVFLLKIDGNVDSLASASWNYSSVTLSSEISRVSVSVRTCSTVNLLFAGLRAPPVC